MKRLKRSICGAWHIQIAFESPQYCKRYAHFLIPDHWGLKFGHAVTHCRDRFVCKSLSTWSVTMYARLKQSILVLGAFEYCRNTARDMLII